MDQTTLVTFILDCEPGTRCVDLFGSWDNFRKPYPLQKDKQMGHGRWTTCPRFKNIICDGDPAQSMAPREGALRMGGLYWFFFKINDDLECPNNVLPTTSTCPLLPGQTVNVLEVPYLTLDHRANDRATSEPPMTLDPTRRHSRLLRLLVKSETPASPSDTLVFSSGDQRLAYLRKTLERLHTAACHSHMITALGHALPLHFGDMTISRPATAPVQLFSTNVEAVCIPSESGMSKSSLEVSRAFGAEDPAKSPVNQIVPGGSHSQVGFLKQPQSISEPCYDRASLQGAVLPRPQTDGEYARRLFLANHPANDNTDTPTGSLLPQHVYTTATSPRSAKPASYLSQLVASLERSESTIGHEFDDMHCPAEGDISAIEEPDRLPPLSPQHSSAYMTPESMSPFPGTSYTSRSMLDEPTTPFTDYSVSSGGGRGGQLYRLIDSPDRLGTMLDELSLSSQETTKVNITCTASSMMRAVSSACDHIGSPAAMRIDARDMIDAPACTTKGMLPMIDDHSYLGSAIQ